MNQRLLREWLALIILSLVSGVMLGVMLHAEHQSVEATERDRLQVEARVIDEYLDRQFSSINNALKGVRDAMPAWREGGLREQATGRLQALLQVIPGVGFMGISDARGDVLASNLPLRVGAFRSLHEFFNTPSVHSDPDIVYLSAPYVEELGMTSVLVGRAVLDTDKKYAGMVYARLDPEFFSVVMRSALYAPKMLASLVTPQGQLFLHVSSGTAVINTNLGLPGSLLTQHRDSGRAGNIFQGQSAASGVDSLVALRTVKPSMLVLDKPLVIQVSRDVSAVYQTWRQRAVMFVSFYGVLALVSVLALYVYQRQRLGRRHLAAVQETERQENAERLELALSGAELGLWDRNFCTNVRTYNERWSAMLGYGPGEIDVLEVTWQELLHPDDLACATDALGRHIRGESNVFESEHRLRHKAGHWVWILARGRVVARDENGMPVRMVGTHMDISERKSAEVVLRESEARFRNLTELSSDWYWEMDAQFRLTRMEGSQAENSAREWQSDMGLTRWEVSSYNMTEAQWAPHRATLEAHEVCRDFEVERKTLNGERMWVSISGAPFFSEQGVFLGYRGVARNITERKLAEQKIEQLAFYDELTGLPNRRLLTNRLQKALSVGVRSKNHGALLFIDLDNFKDLNDTQGHDVGDLLLQQVAIRLRHCVREMDTVSRLGGDEFVVILEELSTLAEEAAVQSEGVGKKILAALGQPFELLGQYHHSTPSIGIALFHEQLQSVDELLKWADLAMYQAKAAGRNTLRFFNPEMQAAATARAAVEADLRRGLTQSELRLYYQPVVNEQRRMTGVEALVRWQHPRRGLVSPGEFITVAEQTGLIVPLGEWVLQTACEQLVAWAEHRATSELSIAVNVSARQFHQPDFVDQVMALLRKTGANPGQLKLELTESLLLSDVADTVRKMRELCAVGVKFSLDDFGTGYSSLSYLKSLPLDQLKIDQSFVRDIMTDSNDAAIAVTILALARSMELSVVAEGVETEGQMQFLLKNGCRAFQGYLFGRPMPVQALELALEETVG